MEPLLTSRQAAAYLGIRPQTLRKWRVTGQGPRYIRLGDGPRARVAYRADDVREWLDARTFSHTSEETAKPDRVRGKQ